MLFGPWLYVAAAIALIGAGFTGGWKAQAGRVERAQKARMTAEASQATAEAALKHAQAIGEAQRQAATGAKAEADRLRARGPEIRWKTRQTVIEPGCPGALKFLRDQVAAEQAGGAP